MTRTPRLPALARHLAVALALAAAGATASAETRSVQASLSNFQITLVDLAPDDGVTPALAFATPDQVGVLRSLVLPFNFGSPLFSSSTWSALGAARSDTLSVLGYTFASSVNDGIGQTASFNLTGDGVNHGSGEAALMGDVAVTVTPNTRVTISATASAAVTGDNDYAIVNLGFSDSLNSYFAQIEAMQRPYWDTSLVVPSIAATPLVISFENNTSTTMSGNLHVAAGGSIYATAVPEPAAWALMAGGLLLVSRTARRRR